METQARDREWARPRTTAEMRLATAEFTRRHGPVSRAVHEAFRRHRQLDTLRTLVIRGAEGERVNLAARALALGPMPEAQSRHFPAEALARCHDLEAGFARDQDRRDLEVVMALQREAAEFRG